jgi:beta-glucanase (GH16 family)
VRGRIRALVAVGCLLLGSTLTAAPAQAAQQWQLVAMDNFNSLNTKNWSVYDGTPSCCVATHWATSQVTTTDGMLKLTSTKQSNGSWLNGGLSAANWPAAVRTYGEYVARVRLDKGAGISAAALLWPVSDQWPPEIDFFEVGGDHGNRDQEFATEHRAPDNAQIQNIYNGDLTQWHTVAVQWLPDTIIFTVDGQQIGKINDRSYIPTQPMWPAFQMQVDQNSSGQPTATATGSVSMYIDYLAVYAPATGTAAGGGPPPPAATTTPPPGSPTNTPSSAAPTTTPGTSDAAVGPGAQSSDGAGETSSAATATAAYKLVDNMRYIWIVVAGLAVIAALLVPLIRRQRKRGKHTIE